MSGLVRSTVRDRIVVANVGAQQQRLLPIDGQFETRQIPCVVIEDTVGFTQRCTDIAMVIDHRKRIVVLKRAMRARRLRRRRNIERRFVGGIMRLNEHGRNCQRTAGCCGT